MEPFYRYTKGFVFIFLLHLLTVTVVVAQDLHEYRNSKVFREAFRQAESHMINAAYEQAMDVYDQLLERDSANSNLHFLAGFCHEQAGSDPSVSRDHLEKAVLNINELYREGSHFEIGAPPLAYYLLGESYLMNYQFDKAIEAFETYKGYLDRVSFAEIEYVNRAIKSCEVAKQMIRNPVNAVFTPLPQTRFPSGRVSHPVISGDGSVMIFLVTEYDSRQTAMIRKSGDGWTEPRMIDEQLGLSDRFHPVSLSFEGDVLFLSVTGMRGPDIYTSAWDGQRWMEAEKMGGPVNTKYAETHASISSDGQTLYFTSDRKGGWGALDLYRTRLDEDGEWQDAENLGFGMNTYYNEETPFIAENDSVLYFSSEGRETMGGYDVYRCRIDQDGHFTEIENLGYPVSTPGDDLFYNPGWNDSISYFARSAESFKHGDQLYAVRILPPADTVTEQPEQLLADKEPLEDRPVEEPLEPEGSGQAASPQEDAFYYIVNSILFDYNDSTLNGMARKEAENLATMMKRYEEVRVELIGSADAKGRAEYNMKLSESRARAVAEYLVGQGVSSDRILVSATGEEQPVARNSYADGSDAPPGRALNRNVTIRINNKGLDKVVLAEIFVPAELVPAAEKVYSILLQETESPLDTMPRNLNGQEVTLVVTDESVMYLLGTFTDRRMAKQNLDAVIDMGYHQAGIMEKRRFDKVIHQRTAGDLSTPTAYTIQILALKNPVELSFFTNLEGVEVFPGEDGLHRYVYGRYSTIAEAKADLKMVEQKGFENPFIRSCRYYMSTTSSR